MKNWSCFCSSANVPHTHTVPQLKIQGYKWKWTFAFDAVQRKGLKETIVYCWAKCRLNEKQFMITEELFCDCTIWKTKSLKTVFSFCFFFFVIWNKSGVRKNCSRLPEVVQRRATEALKSNCAALFNLAAANFTKPRQWLDNTEASR